MENSNTNKIDSDRFEQEHGLPEIKDRDNYKWLMVDKPEFAKNHPVQQYIIVLNNEVNITGNKIPYDEAIKLEDNGKISGNAKAFGSGKIELNFNASMLIQSSNLKKNESIQMGL